MSSNKKCRSDHNLEARKIARISRHLHSQVGAGVMAGWLSLSHRSVCHLLHTSTHVCREHFPCHSGSEATITRIFYIWKLYVNLSQTRSRQQLQPQGCRHELFQTAEDCCSVYETFTVRHQEAIHDTKDTEAQKL